MYIKKHLILNDKKANMLHISAFKLLAAPSDFLCKSIL